MGSPKIKSLVIAALVLLNVVFLTVIIADNYTDAQSLREAVENACTILQLSGISINPDDVRTGSEIRTMRTSRVRETEEVIAYAVLGASTLIDQSVIYIYENPERGTVEFYSAGVFEIRLNEGVITSEGGVLSTAQNLLRDMKLDTTIYTSAPGSQRYEVTFLCRYRDASIFNCSIELTFENGSLLMIRGRYVPGIEPMENGTELSQVGTALLGFLAAVKRGDITCERIYRVEAGYLHRVVGPFGEGVLTPAWMFDTDTGRYITDVETGETRPAT